MSFYFYITPHIPPIYMHCVCPLTNLCNKFKNTWKTYIRAFPFDSHSLSLLNVIYDLLFFSLIDLIAAWAAFSLIPPSAQRTYRRQMERRETPVTIPTVAPWREWAPVRRSTWTSCCHTHQTSPLTSPHSRTASLIRSVLSAGWRPRSHWENCAQMSTAMRSVQYRCGLLMLVQIS